MPGISFNRSKDQKILIFTIHGEPPTTLRLDAAGVEMLINEFVRVRAEMQPPHPEQYVTMEKGTAIFDPTFAVDGDAMTENALLHLREPGLGWRHYMFSRSRCRLLAEQLRQIAEASPGWTNPGTAD